MCFFVTLIVDGPSPAIVKSLMRSKGRDALPVENPSIRQSLKANEKQYLTTRGLTSCDCNSVLIRHPHYLQSQLERVQLENRGWAPNRIERYLKKEYPPALAKDTTSDTFELWVECLNAILDLPETKTAGLLTHNYNSAIEEEGLKEEAFNTRRMPCSRNEFPGKIVQLDCDIVLICRA